MTAQKFEKFSFESDFVEIALRENIRRKKEQEEEARLAAQYVTQEELAQEKDAAFERGRQAGIQESMQAAHDEADQKMDTLFQPLLAEFDAQKNAASQLAAQKGILLMARMLRTLTGHASDAYKQETLEHLINQTLEQAMEHSQCLLRCSPAMAEMISQSKTLKAIMDQREIHIMPQPQMAEAECHLSWNGGGVHSHLESTLKEFEQQLLTIANDEPLQEQQTAPAPEANTADVMDTAEEPAEAEPDTIPQMAGADVAEPEAAPSTDTQPEPDTNTETATETDASMPQELKD